MTEKKPDLKRDNTMQVTAKEGVKFLKDAGENSLLVIQGLDNDDSAAHKKPRMKRESTMAGTTKAALQYLRFSSHLTGHMANNAEAAAAEDCNNSPPIKPKLAKFTTMLQTKKEGEAFLSSKSGLLKDDLPDDEEPSPKKLKFVNEKGDNKKPQVKRISTLVKTAKEGEELLKELGYKDDNPDSERRRTRSQARGDVTPLPPLKKEKKRVSTNNGGKRGRKGRPRKDEKISVEDSKSADEEEGGTEEEDDAKKLDDIEDNAEPQKKDALGESEKEEIKPNNIEKTAQAAEI